MIEEAQVLEVSSENIAEAPTGISWEDYMYCPKCRGDAVKEA